MLKLFIPLILILLFPSPTFSQIKEYKLLDKTVSADINYSQINVLDTKVRGMALLDQVFNPIKGEFTVYRFMAIFNGQSFTGKTKEFHDILIVKTDSKGKIFDAYQYTLEWAELPAENDLYKSSCKDLYLTNEMSIQNFLFTRPWYYDEEDIIFKESGILKLK